MRTGNQGCNGRVATKRVRRNVAAVVAGLGQACVVGCAAVGCSVLPDLDHVPGYLWLLWPDTFAGIDPRWFGRPLHIHFLVLGFVLCGVSGALFVGLSMASKFLRDR